MNESAQMLALLRAVPLFAGLSDKELKAVLRIANEIDHPPGHDIVGEGQLGVGFHLILSGEARVSQRGRELTPLGPGQFFGEIALLDGQGRSATVTTVGPVRTLTIVAWSFESLLKENPLIAIGLLKELCARLRRAEARTPG